jgi:hypothetical protein
MTLYTIVSYQKGCGTGREQSILASSVESAVKMFYKANTDAHIERVKVGERVVYYGVLYETDTSKSP